MVTSTGSTTFIVLTITSLEETFTNHDIIAHAYFDRVIPCQLHHPTSAGFSDHVAPSIGTQTVKFYIVDVKSRVVRTNQTRSNCFSAGD